VEASDIVMERVLVVGPKDTIAMVDDLAPKGFEIVKALHNSSEMKAALPGTDYLVGFVQQYVTPQLFRDAPKLKLIQMLSAGYDRADLEAARKSKVPLCNNGGANSVAVSEHALLLMLAVSRRLITQHNSVTAGRWHGNAPPMVHEVRNKVLGIVGLGTIGKKVARLALAFGMVVHYYDIKRLSEAEEDALGVRFRLLPEILRGSDILSLHVPLNESTRAMIGAGELAVMKPSAIIVNTSRGPVIDEKALTAVLAAGKLFGAGLDVFDQEPIPPDNPLLKLDNVVLTAHLAGPTFESNITRLRNGFDNVQRIARGEPALWVVPELLA
jgi:phosphoglycerate dehydrogenase-like enzyme